MDYFKKIERSVTISADKRSTVDLQVDVWSQDLNVTKFILKLDTTDSAAIDLTNATVRVAMVYSQDGQDVKIEAAGIVEDVATQKIAYVMGDRLAGFEGTVTAGFYVTLSTGQRIDIQNVTFNMRKSLLDKDLDVPTEDYYQTFEDIVADVQSEGEKAKTEINAVPPTVTEYATAQKQAIDNIVSDVQSTGDTAKGEIKATLPSIQTQVSQLSESITENYSELKEELADLGNKKVLRTSLKCDYNEDVPIDNIKPDFVYTLGDLSRIYRDTVEITLNIYSNGGEGYIYFWRHDSVYGQILVYKNKYTFTRGVNTIIIPILEDYFDDNPNESLDFLSIAIQCVTEGALTSQSGGIYLYTNGDPFTWYSPISDFQTDVGDFIKSPNYWEGNVKTNKTYPCIDVYMKSYIEKRKTGIITVAQDGTGDYTTINDAVRNAGDIGNPTTILIREGVYNEVVYLRNKHEISLVGTNRDKCIIKNTRGEYAFTPVMVNGDFEIRNLTIRMEENGFFPTYTDNVFATYPGYALHIDGNSKDMTKQTIGRIVNCTLYSEAFPAVGMGVNQNQKVIFENCEMIRNCTKDYFKQDNWKGALVCHSSNYTTAPNQKFVMKDCVLHSNYGYSGNIRGELGDSSEFEVTAINNTCYSDETGLNSFEYTVGQSRLNSISHGNTSSVLNAGN